MEELIELEQTDIDELRKIINDYFIARCEQNDTEILCCAEDIVNLLIDKGV